jgi:predicted dehydrogenase
VQAVKEYLDAGKLGLPGLLRIHAWESWDSHGCLAREIDLACWYFGEPPNAIYASRSQPLGSSQAGTDYLQLHFGFAGGGMALIDHAHTLRPGGGYYSLSLIGSAGAAYADDHHNVQLLNPGDHATALLTGQGALHLVAELQEFIDAIHEQREPAVTSADALRAVQVAEAVAALADGEALRWNGQQYEVVAP